MGDSHEAKGAPFASELPVCDRADGSSAADHRQSTAGERRRLFASIILHKQLE